MTLPRSAPPAPDAVAGTIDVSREVTLGCTDLGNARRFLDAHGDRFRYSGGRWLVFAGSHWVEDTAAQAHAAAQETAASIYAEAAAAPAAADRQLLARHAARSQSSRAIHAMLTEAAPLLAVAPDAWDVLPHAINTASGVLDLDTLTLTRHDPTQLLTRCTAAPWDPEAACPTWEAVLARALPDPEHRDFLQRFMGYSLAGAPREQVMCCSVGDGANGKSLIHETVSRTLGTYARTINFGALLEQGRGQSTAPELAQLPGARFVWASEPPEGARFAEATVKAITGNDPVTVRALYRDPITFRPAFVLFLAMNRKPHVRGRDHGIWRRLKVLPFTQTIPPAERDPGLLDRLEGEAAGILAWLVGGYQLYRRDGLRPPASIEAAVDAYRAESDELAPFLAECCELNPAHKATTAAVYKRYVEWATGAGEHVVSTRKLTQMLRDRGIESHRLNSGMIYVGVRLRGGER